MERARGNDGLSAELIRCLFQERGRNEAEFIRGAAGAVVVLRELRRIEAAIKSLRG
ncbi:hypothetical protein [Sorangium sp. So ce1151]|uniref:hypothetical protein n=1 Tax=Sorangium sp. So ce1151 TaxID=3133332 RepID=UPI003F628D9B